MKLERLLKAAANQRRLDILKFLSRGGEASVADIADCIKLSFKATSKHLLILTQTDILDRRQVSLNIYYRLVKSQHPIIKTIISNL